MSERKKRIYVDTSVVLGNFDIDETRRQKTSVFWNAVRSGEVIAVVSSVLDNELKSNMVEIVQDFLAALPKNQIERIVATDESDDLAEQYCRKGCRERLS